MGYETTVHAELLEDELDDDRDGEHAPALPPHGAASATLWCGACQAVTPHDAAHLDGAEPGAPRCEDCTRQVGYQCRTCGAAGDERAGTRHCSRCGGTGRVGVPPKVCPEWGGKGYVRT